MCIVLHPRIPQFCRWHPFGFWNMFVLSLSNLFYYVLYVLLGGGKVPTCGQYARALIPFCLRRPMVVATEKATVKWMRYRVIALVQTVRWHHNATESTEWNLWCSVLETNFEFVDVYIRRSICVCIHLVQNYISIRLLWESMSSEALNSQKMILEILMILDVCRVGRLVLESASILTFFHAKCCTKRNQRVFPRHGFPF